MNKTAQEMKYMHLTNLSYANSANIHKMHKLTALSDDQTLNSNTEISLYPRTTVLGVHFYHLFYAIFFLAKTSTYITIRTQQEL